MRSDAQSAPTKLVMEIGEALLEPRAFDADLEILEAELEELIVGQRGPSKLTRHGVSKADEAWSFPMDTRAVRGRRRWRGRLPVPGPVS